MTRPSVTRFLVVSAATILLTSCSVIPARPPELPESYVPTAVESMSTTETGNLTPYGFSEAQRMAVRVRNVSCTGVTRGTGFALDANTLVTNKHVVEGATTLQLNTYDGKDVSVTNTSIADLADLAVVRTSENLEAFPVIAEQDAEVGSPVTVVGYPNGGALTVTTGKVLRYLNDPLNQNLGEVIYSDALVEHGSSGSAVLDAEGRLIGVVYAKNTSGASYIIPASTLMSVMEQDRGFEDQKNASCSTSPTEPTTDE